MKRTTRPTSPAVINDCIVRFNRKGYISKDTAVDMVGFYCNLPTCASNESITYRDFRTNLPGYGNLLNAVTATVISEKLAASLKHIMERKGYTVDIIKVTSDKTHIDAIEYVNI